MSTTKPKIASESHLEPIAFPKVPESKVRINAGEVLALLMHASRTNRAWLEDFSEETFEVSQDFYEVILAYKRIAIETNRAA